MAKKALPPAFLKNMKKAKGAAAVGKGDPVVDSKGKSGTVTAVTGGMVSVKHDDGTSDKHPASKVKKAASKMPKKGK